MKLTSQSTRKKLTPFVQKHAQNPQTSPHQCLMRYEIVLSEGR